MADQEHPKVGPSLEQALEAAKRNGGVVVITNAGKIAGMLCVLDLPEIMRRNQAASPDAVQQLALDESFRLMDEGHAHTVLGEGFIDVAGGETTSGPDTTEA